MGEGKPDKGAEHRVLERFVGSWDLTGKIYDKDPEAEPMEMDGWWESDFFGDSSVLICKSKGRAGGAPFERVILLCYDAQKGKYTAAGANTAFPGRLLLDEGTYDEASQTISWTEHDVLVLGSGEKVLARGEETFKDEDTILQTVYIKRRGSETYVKWVETTFRRRK
jgi:hypothetical protein